ncbi:hypothetical protein [Allomuricauda sp. NBRC 101325]|uniref:hypothetical protein n=1 Tax=Allomuricauda sp. NBRC 101325 TaxID=1113758 RepID=UPI0024A0FE00|nr:hypothetical protein [Muricauda sp. NBRC 101325]GLU45151.1 esterase [Muricauda sp. NBRC 101325]
MNVLQSISTRRFLGILILLCTITTWKGNAQDFTDLIIPESPLILRAQGSFYSGGEVQSQSFDELGSFGPGQSISVNQMYVRYMIPQTVEGVYPIVMIHGMALTGKTWETTPDGRMGWDEYFVRQGYPVYVVDQVARGRSGFNQRLLNRVRTGIDAPQQLAPARRFSDEFVWRNFRIGMEKDQPFDITLYPVDYLDEFSKQGVPDLSGYISDYGPNYSALSELASNLEGAILMSHSQSGFFPMEVALLNQNNVTGIIAVEPGACATSLNEEQLRILAQMSTLIVFGDYLEVPTGIDHSWKVACEQCETYASQVNGVGGNVKVIKLAESGIKGNSHMLMQDTNHIELADSIIQWVKDNIKK